MTAAAKYESYSVISDFAERERVARLARRMAEIRDSAKKMDKYAEIAAQEGTSAKTLQRLFKLWRDSGEDDLVLADKRKYLMLSHRKGDVIACKHTGETFGYVLNAKLCNFVESCHLNTCDLSV